MGSSSEQTDEIKMNYQLIIRPEAELDIEESYNWYEDQAMGLGDEFLLALHMRLFRN